MYLFLLHEYSLACMHVCAIHECLVPMETEGIRSHGSKLQMVVSPHVGAEN